MWGFSFSRMSRLNSGTPRGEAYKVSRAFRVFGPTIEFSRSHTEVAAVGFFSEYGRVPVSLPKDFHARAMYGTISHLFIYNWHYWRSYGRKADLSLLHDPPRCFRCHDLACVAESGSVLFP